MSSCHEPDELQDPGGTFGGYSAAIPPTSSGWVGEDRSSLCRLGGSAWGGCVGAAQVVGACAERHKLRLAAMGRGASANCSVITTVSGKAVPPPGTTPSILLLRARRALPPPPPPWSQQGAGQRPARLRRRQG